MADTGNALPRSSSDPLREDNGAMSSKEPTRHDARSKRIWGIFGAFVTTLLAAGVVGGVEHAVGNSHLFGGWEYLIGAGSTLLGLLIGRAAA